MVNKHIKRCPTPLLIWKHISKHNELPFHSFQMAIIKKDKKKSWQEK